MRIKFQGEKPTQAREDDAGYVLRSTERLTLPPGKRATIPCNFRVAIPKGCAGFVCSRSGLAHKHGVFVLNAPGIIDAGYRDNVGVILQNSGDFPFQIEPGDRIAQIVIVKALPVTWEEADELGETERGEGGFGSSGTQ